MKPVVAVFILLASISLWIHGCGPQEPECAKNTDCKELYLCNPDGKCVEGKPVELLEAELPKGIIDDAGYRYLLPVKDGLQPFRWSLRIVAGNDILDWMEIAPGAGELRAVSGKTPSKMGLGSITVMVTDSSNGGDGQSSEHTYEVSVVECIEDRVCYQTADQRCQVGVRLCSEEGLLDENCKIDGFSDQLDHCGPACEACDAHKASDCVDGACKCGSIEACGIDQSCCSGGCFDLDTSLQHCGFCNNACDAAAMHATGVQCKSAACDYELCVNDYLNCDGNSQNGCETKRDNHNCHRCSDDCMDTSVYVHTKNQQCKAGQCVYECTQNHADCSDDTVGCETALGTKNNCSTCGDQCNTPEMPICLPIEDVGYTCGCAKDSDCSDDRLCCDAVCVKRTDMNCRFCGHKCSVVEGGYTCKKDTISGWHCGCYDIDNHTDCRGRFDFSEAKCNPTTNDCFCPGAHDCSGDLDDMCCSNGNSNACSNLYENSAHCGACQRKCGSGQVCTKGACSCSAQCPNLSGTGWEESWSCVENKCICPTYQKACPVGQYCCGEFGCCLSDCRDSQNADCSTECTKKGRIWCDWGCCERCESTDDC